MSLFLNSAVMNSTSVSSSNSQTKGEKQGEGNGSVRATCDIYPCGSDAHKYEQHRPYYWKQPTRRSERRLDKPCIVIHAVPCNQGGKAAYSQRRSDEYYIRFKLLPHRAVPPEILCLSILCKVMQKIRAFARIPEADRYIRLGRLENSKQPYTVTLVLPLQPHCSVETFTEGVTLPQESSVRSGSLPPQA